MILYSFFRSSAAYRVRIALNLKGAPHEIAAVDIGPGAANRKPEYLALNPQGRVPALRLDEGELLTQSLAILEYIEEAYPEPPLLPADLAVRARIRAVALIVVADMHPLINASATRRLSKLGHSEAEVQAWQHDFMRDGFGTLEQLVEPGPFAFGTAPTLADVCIVPQIYTARRLGMEMDAFPKMLAIEKSCAALPAFAEAHPNRQPDAV